MKSITNLLILSGVLFFVILPAQVQGEDFYFDIPVELNNIPKELVRWSIRVIVYDSANKEIAVGYKNLTVHGNVRGNVYIKFNAKSGKNAASAKKYLVSLLVRAPNAKGWDRPERVMNSSGPWPYDTKKPMKTRSYKIIK